MRFLRNRQLRGQAYHCRGAQRIRQDLQFQVFTAVTIFGPRSFMEYTECAAENSPADYATSVVYGVALVNEAAYVEA